MHAFLELPTELVLQIFSEVDPIDLVRLAQACFILLWSIAREADSCLGLQISAQYRIRTVRLGAGIAPCLPEQLLV